MKNLYTLAYKGSSLAVSTMTAWHFYCKSPAALWQETKDYYLKNNYIELKPVQIWQKELIEEVNFFWYTRVFTRGHCWSDHWHREPGAAKNSEPRNWLWRTSKSCRNRRFGIVFCYSTLWPRTNLHPERVQTLLAKECEVLTTVGTFLSLKFFKSWKKEIRRVASFHFIPIKFAVFSSN